MNETPPNESRQAPPSIFIKTPDASIALQVAARAAVAFFGCHGFTPDMEHKVLVVTSNAKEDVQPAAMPPTGDVKRFAFGELRAHPGAFPSAYALGLVDVLPLLACMGENGDDAITAHYLDRFVFHSPRPCVAVLLVDANDGSAVVGLAGPAKKGQSLSTMWWGSYPKVRILETGKE